MMLSLLVLLVHLVLTSSEQINCNGTGDCIIDCETQNCTNNKIYGNNATILEVNCPNNQSCFNTNVMCPAATNSSCTITCIDHDSCNKATITITASTSKLLNISCIGKSSCQYINANAIDNVHSIDSIMVSCTKENSCYQSQLNFNNISSIIDIVDVSCTNYFSCYNSTFITPYTHSLNILCSTDVSNFNTMSGGCMYFNMKALVAHSLNIECIYRTACSYANFDIITMDNVNVNITCDNQPSTFGSCEKAQFDISYNDTDRIIPTTNASVFCAGCLAATFNFDYLNVINITCSAANACWQTIFNGTSVETMNVFCDDKSSCYASSVYCPSVEECHMECIDKYHSCSMMNIYIPSDYKHGKLDIRCPPSNDNSSCDDIIFRCQPLSNDPFYPLPPLTVYQFNNNTNKYECRDKGTRSCCPWVYGTEITCDDHIGEECDIDCSSGDINCSYGSINGSMSSFLSVKCDSYLNNTCDNLLVLCPNNKKCEVDCWGANACSSTKIQYYGTDHGGDLLLKCQDYKSCPHMIIIADYIDTLSITSNDSAALQVGNVLANYAKQVNLLFNGVSSQTFQLQQAAEINLTCDGYYSCQYLTINASEAHQVYISTNENFAWSQNTLYAYNADNVYLECKSDEYGRPSCQKGHHYIPQHNFQLKCYGFGCQSIGNFYVWDNIKNITFDINGCNQCHNLEECVTNFDILCGLYYNGSVINSKYMDTFNGTEQECGSNQCGCITMINEGKQNFENNINDIVCPTTNNGGGSDKKNIKWYIFVLIGIGIIFFVLLGFLLIRKCDTKPSNVGNDTKPLLDTDDKTLN